MRYITDKDDFYKKRAKTIGSSDIPIIIGLTTQWKTPYDLWKQKTGRDFNEHQSTTVTEIGHELEGMILRREIRDISDQETAHKFLVDYIQHEYERPVEWQPATAFHPFTFWKHKEVNAFTASPDCVNTSEGRKDIIEAKSGKRFANLRREDNYFDGYDEDLTDINGIPLRVLFQTLWQAFVIGDDCTHITVRALIDTNMDLSYKFVPDAAIQSKIVQYAEKFLWHIQKDTPPEPVGMKDLNNILPSVIPKVRIVHGKEALEFKNMKEKKKRLKQAVNKIKIEIEDINNALMLEMSDHKFLELSDGTKIATQVIGDNLFSLIGPKKVQENHPEIYKLLNEAGYIKTYNTRHLR